MFGSNKAVKIRFWKEIPDFEPATGCMVLPFYRRNSINAYMDQYVFPYEHWPGGPELGCWEMGEISWDDFTLEVIPISDYHAFVAAHKSHITGSFPHTGNRPLPIFL